MAEMNVGPTDRALRVLLGLVLIGLALGEVIGPWGYLGMLPLLTGVIARCPMYRLLGIRTTPR